jgi:hypothetical protein
MFSTDSNNFLNEPLSFGFNTAKQIFLFLHVSDFQGPSDVKQNQYFCHIIFQDFEDCEKKKSTENATRRDLGGTTWGPLSPSCVLSMQSWSPPTRLELKLTIKRTPRAILWWGDTESWNTPNRCADCEDRRRDATRAAPGCPFDSIDTISFSNMIKREQLTPGLWDCGSYLYQTLSRTS